MKKSLPILKNDKGIVLITAYMIVAALSILTAATIKIAVTEYNFASRYFRTTKAYYLAEAGVDQTAYTLAQKVANYDNEPVGASDEWTDLSSSTTDFLSTGFDVDVACYSLDLDHAGADPTQRERHYQIYATVTDPDTNIEKTLHQVIIRRKVYTFQHAIFYSDELKFTAGKDMTITGQIHTNHDIYAQPDAGATITIDTDEFHSAGNIYKMTTGGNPADGNIKILIAGTANYAKMEEAGDSEPLDSRRSDWSTESQIRWNGTAKSSVHGVTAMAGPEPQSFAPDGYYADNAVVKVINGTAYESGSALVEGTDIPYGTIETSTDFYNYRETKYVNMTDIDVEKFAGWCDVNGLGEEVPPGGDPASIVGKAQLYSNHLPNNGLMYATRDDTPGSQQPGIRLLNGTKIHIADGFTLVTNDPAYIQGDFNVQVYEGDSDNKRSVAIMGDALNIVSGNWDDANSSGGLSVRIAVDSEVNAAFLCGASGGFNNFPRLHEKWTDKTLSILGSFVKLWDPQIALGPWGDSSYKAPTRNWDWDTDFGTLDNLPAYTPFAVEIDRQAVWEGESDDVPAII